MNRINSVEEEADISTVTPGDYTVLVHGLPRDATAAEIRDHFNGLYALNSACQWLPRATPWGGVAHGCGKNCACVCVCVCVYVVCACVRASAARSRAPEAHPSASRRTSLFAPVSG